MFGSLQSGAILIEALEVPRTSVHWLMFDSSLFSGRIGVIVISLVTFSHMQGTPIAFLAHAPVNASLIDFSNLSFGLISCAIIDSAVPPTPNDGFIQQKCEAVSSINLKVVANPNQINDAIPHTRIDMEYRHRHTDSHSLNKNECCSLSLILLKIATFSDSDSAKTLSICPPYGLLHKTIQRYENIPQTALIFRVLHLNICHCLDSASSAAISAMMYSYSALHI